MTTQTYSIDYKLWITIRRLFYTHGQVFLDLILFIDDPTEFEDYHKRYKNFDEEFEKHFSLSAFWNSQVGSDYPLVLIDFQEVNGSWCDPEYLLYMNYAYATISPADCRDNSVDILNSPEGILGYKSKLEQAFLDVINMRDCVDMSDCPELYAKFRIGRIAHTSLNQANETQFGTSNYQIFISNNC